MNAYMVTFKPNEVRPNGSEVSVLAVNSDVEWEVESAKKL